MKQRVEFWADSDKPGFYIYDYDFPHPIGPFPTIADALDWLTHAGVHIKTAEQISII